MSSIASAAVSGGNENRIRVEVTRIAQVNCGIRNIDMPGARGRRSWR